MRSKRGIAVIRLCVPGTLLYRDLALRVVAAACKLARGSGSTGGSMPPYPDAGSSSSVAPGHPDAALREARAAPEAERRASPAWNDFDVHVVSAFGEAFNNVCLHGYRDRPGDVDIEFEPGPDAITIRMTDTGVTFDPRSVPPPSLDTPLESGMGIFIMSSFMEIDYEPGPPNVLVLTKPWSGTLAGTAARGQLEAGGGANGQSPYARFGVSPAEALSRGPKAP